MWPMAVILVARYVAVMVVINLGICQKKSSAWRHVRPACLFYDAFTFCDAIPIIEWAGMAFNNNDIYTKPTLNPS